MKAFFVALGTALYDRVWSSYKSTILGILVACVGELLNYTYLSVPDPRVHAITALLTTVFLSWKDKHVKDGSIKMLTLTLAFLSFGAMAQGSPAARRQAAEVNPNAMAEAIALDPTAVQPAPAVTPLLATKIGGCLKNGKVCFGPTLALSVAAINLSKKVVEGSFSPGVGVGVTFNPGLWSSIGVDLYLNLDPGAQNASGAVLGKFLNGYIRAGFSKGFIGDTSSRLLFGTGIDL